jgi:hypothetical protein
MTIEKAIQILKSLWCYKDCKYSDTDVRKALDMAIKALENSYDNISKTHLIKRLKNAEEDFKADNMESISCDNDDPFVDGVLSAMFFIRVMILNEPTR